MNKTNDIKNKKITAVISAASQHTILLIQTKTLKSSKTYEQFNTKKQLMQFIITIYETKLRNEKPNFTNIKYNIQDLFGYIDELPDLACLLFNSVDNSYLPKDKQWLKDEVF